MLVEPFNEVLTDSATHFGVSRLAKQFFRITVAKTIEAIATCGLSTDHILVITDIAARIGAAAVTAATTVAATADHPGTVTAIVTDVVIAAAADSTTSCYSFSGRRIDASRCSPMDNEPCCHVRLVRAR